MALRQRGWGQPPIHASSQWAGVVNNATNQSQAAAALQAWAAAWNAGHPAAASATPAATAAPQRQPVDPFLTPEEMLQRNQQYADAAAEKANLGLSLSQKQIDTKYQIAQTQKQAAENTAQTVDNMISRGLFQSSIKDGDVADIAASSVARQDYLQSALTTLATYTTERMKTIDANLATNETQWNNMAVANAQGIEPAPGDTPTSPTANAPAPPAPTGAVPQVTAVKPQPTTPVAAQSGMTAYGHPMQFKPATSVSTKPSSIATVVATKAHLPKLPKAPTVKRA